MKRSEYVRLRKDHWRNPVTGKEAAELDAEAAEAAGVIWDPEEGPMVKRLVAEGGRLYADCNGCAGDAATQAEARLAASLYNRREEIAAVAHGCRYRAGRRQDANPYDLLRWAKLLDGKAHGADAQDGEGRS